MRLATLLAPDLKRALSEAPEQIAELTRELHPEDVADLLRELSSDEVGRVLAALPSREAANAFERLDDHEQTDVVSHLPDEVAVDITACMAPDRRARFLRVACERGSRLLAELRATHPVAAREAEALQRWPERSAGRLMTTSFVALPEATTLVGDALDAVRAHNQESNEPLYAVYAVDDGGRLTGFSRLREFAPLPRDYRMVDLWRRRFVSVSPETEQNEAARLMAKYDLSALPVVDGGRLIGVITIDDVVDVLNEEATRAFERAGALEPLDMAYFKTTLWVFLRKRGVWLLVLFIEEFFTQTALRHYDPVFEAIHGASYYVPLLISTGGNSGSQSATLVIRGLSVHEIELRHWWRILIREAGIGLALGALLGAVGFSRVLMYHDQGVTFALTIALTLVGIVVVGCTVGSMLPLGLRRLGLDPATSSTPFIASLVDVLGIIVFVHIAKVIMTDVIARAPLHAH